MRRELQFLVPAEQFNPRDKVLSVKCPWCTRVARVGHQADGTVRVVHVDQVFECRKPVSNNPLLVVAVYFGGLAVLVVAYAAAARMVEPYLCPAVLGAAVLTVVAIGVIHITMIEKMNVSFLKALRILVHSIPAVFGLGRRGTVEHGEGSLAEKDVKPPPAEGQPRV